MEISSAQEITICHRLYTTSYLSKDLCTYQCCCMEEDTDTDGDIAGKTASNRNNIHDSKIEEMRI